MNLSYHVELVSFPPVPHDRSVQKKGSQQMMVPPTISSPNHSLSSSSSRHSSVCTLQMLVQLKVYFLQRRLVPLEALASLLKMLSDYIITEKEQLLAILEFYDVLSQIQICREPNILFLKISTKNKLS